jgi:hypothetical protein
MSAGRGAFDTVKKTSDLKLDGIKIETEKLDGVTSSITFSDASGNVVRVKGAIYDQIKILIPAKPATEKIYVVKGRILEGVPVSVECKSSAEANEKIADIQSAVREAGELRIVEEDREIPF